MENHPHLVSSARGMVMAGCGLNDHVHFDDKCCVVVVVVAVVAVGGGGGVVMVVIVGTVAGIVVVVAGIVVDVDIVVGVVDWKDVGKEGVVMHRLETLGDKER